MNRHRVRGPWEVSRCGDSSGSGEPVWRPVAVPGCWEEAGIDPTDPGPVDYRTVLDIPVFDSTERVWLRFGAVSYACEVFVDERHVGGHIGMWDAFELDLTGVVRPGERAVLRVRAEKPASLTAGPDSPAVPGRYPTRETLAGFLPYVWGHVHGGIWQDVELVVRGPVRLLDPTAWGTPDGRLTVETGVSGPARIAVTVSDPAGTVVAEAEQEAGAQARLELEVPDPRPWSPADPFLYSVSVRCGDGDEKLLRIGLRELRAEGPRLLLNDEPVYPRMALSWGWYPDVLYCDPGPDRVRHDLERLRAMGFNGVKLCLWFPPQYYFDLADELGMLLWVELPMWLPHPTEHFRAQLTAESEALVRAARDHASVVLYTLGCELSAVVGDEILGPLYARVKELGRDALVRDNSGSGEAYGGLAREYADFYDHHLYCEPQHFAETVDYFAPRAREPKPWLFGEFCDLDTFRDLRRLGPTALRRPWWTSSDPAVNPRGARWQYDMPFHERTLRENGFWDRGAELEEISARQAVLHRKVTLEAVRARSDTSGYVVTGERDTPISTAGLIDDFDSLKPGSEEYTSFNDDLVLTLGWDRRRSWIAGGDRPARFDPWCRRAGAIVRAHLVLAHHGRESGPAAVEWSARPPDAQPFAGGRFECAVRPGSVREIGVAEFAVPEVDTPQRATLRATVRVGDETTSNRWSFWLFPAESWRGVEPIALADPGGRLSDLRTTGCQVLDIAEAPGEAVVVATRWTDDVRKRVEEGGTAVLLVDRASDSPVPVLPMPFWREAVKVLEPHPAWGDFPHDGWTDLQFGGIATDLALDTSGLAVKPILRRIDTRTAVVHDYAVTLAWGAGRLLVSTLRFDGSTGDQPLGIARNPAACHLLAEWVRACV